MSVKRFLPLLAIMISVLLLSPSPGSSTPDVAGAPGVLPTPVPPEPDPFSNRYPAVVYLGSPNDLEFLYELGIDIDALRPADGTHPYPGPGDPFEALIATVYVDAGESAQLAEAGLEAIAIPNESRRAHLEYGPGSGAPNAWPTFEQFVTRMQDIANDYADIVEMVSIGTSVQGRDLWCLKVTDNPDLEEDEPEFRYISSMHGDETVGIELILRLAEHLTDNYGSDPDLTGLVDEIEIWLCPIFNPDGYVAGSRNNANGVNLNRDFPDRITDPYDDPGGREPETQAYMYFGYDHRFVMGANYHGGALVVNYPWDSVPNPPDYAPDDALYYDFSVGYAVRNPMIYNGGFPNGVTRGWEWYIIRGGLQDWTYFWRSEHHVTIEVSSIKKPPYEQMDTYWGYNQAAMLWWLERVLSGVRGRVLDARDGTPLDAVVSVAEYADKPPNTVRTDPEVGDYQRVIAEGNYTLTAEANGYISQTHTVNVFSGTTTIQDFALVPMPDLSPSTKLASSNPVLPEERVDYQLVVANIGSATSVNLTDTLPGEVTWSGYLTATQGTPVYADGQISWQGTLDQGQAITVTYGVSVNQCIPGGTWITNQAEMSGGPGAVFTRTASIAVVNAAPGMPDGLTPANGAVSQPLDITLSWAPSADLNCDPLTYTVAFGTDYPPQVVAVGLTETTYTPGWLAGHTTYYWSVTASDGLSQSSGTVWQFTTLNQAPTMPAAISPPNGSSNVPLTQTLTWESDDPDGDPLTYTLAFGPVTPPPVAATDLTSGVYDPGPLSPGTTYYWYVIASDGMSQTAGITLSFTTEALNYYYYYLPTIQKAPTTPGGSHTSSGWFPPSPVGWLARHK